MKGLIVTAKIKALGPIKELTNTKKREFYLETGDEYNADAKFFTIGNNVSLLEGLVVGDEVDVTYDINCRTWKPDDGDTKHFTELKAWKISRVQDEAPAPGVPAETAASVPNDDLPF